MTVLLTVLLTGVCVGLMALMYLWENFPVLFGVYITLLGGWLLWTIRRYTRW